jgi:hypothetical protein
MFVDSDISVSIHPEARRILKSQDEDLAGFAFSCIREHNRILSSNNGPIMKNAPESAVTIVQLPGWPSVCVKELRWRGWGHALKGFFRPTQGLRTFRNGWRLQRQGVNVAAALVLARRKRLGLIESEWIIMEVIPVALEMDRYLEKKIADSWHV